MEADRSLPLVGASLQSTGCFQRAVSLPALTERRRYKAARDGLSPLTATKATLRPPTAGCWQVVSGATCSGGRDDTEEFGQFLALAM
jgi:hypothetical protein